MLGRQLTRSLWCSIRVGNRTLTADNFKPKQLKEDGSLQYLDEDICLLVDRKDNFIGTATKRDCHKVDADGKLKLHRAFSVFLFNNRGEMLMHRRSHEKVTYPGYYTNACCSHPLYIDGKKEDVISAARRRMNYELGIPLDQMDPEKFTLVNRILFQDSDGEWGEHELAYMLVHQNDLEVKPNPNEICEYRYVPKDEFSTYVSSLPAPMTPWFQIIRKNFINRWWDNLHRLKEVAEPDKIYELTAN